MGKAGLSDQTRYDVLLPNGADSTPSEIQKAAYDAWRDGRSTKNVAKAFSRMFDVRYSEGDVIKLIEAQKKLGEPL